MKSYRIFYSFLISLSTLPLIACNAYADRDTSRDQYRHPAQTITFFGLNPEMTVVEISPGKGWYTEFLAGYFDGELIAAHFDPTSSSRYRQNSLKNFRKLLDSDADLFSNVSIQIFDAGKDKFTVPNESVDAIVTFRNIHGWVRNGEEHSAFQLFYEALKPNGILGVVQHRADIGTDTTGSTGYVSEKHVISVAEKAGFFLEAKSEINANPKDTKNYEKGVWTLPPSLRLGDRDKEKYMAIGESDRMTLKFRKPDLLSISQSSHLPRGMQ